jgi:hypothetical protein
MRGIVRREESGLYKALFEAANRHGHQMRLIVPGPGTRTEKPVSWADLAAAVKAGAARPKLSNHLSPTIISFQEPRFGESFMKNVPT